METRPDTRLFRLARAVAFFALLAALVWYAGEVVKPARKANDVGGEWSSFLAMPKDSVDVMFFGTSHVYTSIDPSEIWRARGITSFVLAGPSQKMQVTRYYVKEALARQHPKMVVVEIAGMAYPEQQFDQAFHLTNLTYMPMTANRLAATVFATPSGHRTEVLFDLWAYHDRWRSVTATDFRIASKQAGYEYLKGFVPLTVAKKVDDRDDHKPMPPKTRDAIAYNMPALREIARDCRAHGARLVLMLSPISYPSRSRIVLDATAAEIRKDFPEVSTLDLSDGRVAGLSFGTDFFDPGHLNVRGAEKVAPALAAALAGEYGLPDHSRDTRFAWWEQDAASRDAHVVEKIAATRRFSRDVVADATSTPPATAGSGTPTVTPAGGLR